jgi:hypothetical protein
VNIGSVGEERIKDTMSHRVLLQENHFKEHQVTGFCEHAHLLFCAEKPIWDPEKRSIIDQKPKNEPES